MAKMTEYTAATRFDNGDILIKDGTNGTKKITAANAAIEFAGLISTVNHRNVYRGKNLGTVITDAQKETIRTGKFDDLFIGDYWTINGTRYDIADMDYWYNTGEDGHVFNKHHLVIIPHSQLYTGKMNETNTTEGGYVGSYMYTEGLDQAATKVSDDFGAMLLTHREYLVNAVTDGHPSGGAWLDRTVDLMNEIMVYGCHVHAPSSDGTTAYAKSTIDNTQLAYFSLNPSNIHARQWYWLRDVVSPSYFALVATFGSASCTYASYVDGVRPVFPIGVA